MYESQQLCYLYKLVGHQIQIGIWRVFFAEEGKPENVKESLAARTYASFKSI